MTPFRAITPPHSVRVRSKLLVVITPLQHRRRSAIKAAPRIGLKAVCRSPAAQPTTQPRFLTKAQAMREWTESCTTLLIWGPQMGCF